ncbi:hypothetical protein [Gaoshiqia sediminis]|uniref:Uncharacterized protein n=1 Tax=Gaoshiqia sediminis TaxID=2986998 RepID=A0AA41Y9G9_9BACT|nr:hypothetical protein [Gaoshiqia sediminis]MCW0484061.1 hypothetical protein [Gaoshiqia sediminis]
MTVANASEPVLTDGKWSVESADFSSICRAEPAGKGDVLRGTDGNEISFAFVVYLPKASTILSAGSKVTIAFEDGSLVNATLKRQQNGQLNSRLWV